MNNTNHLIIIIGPTAIGKTSLSVNLAKYLNCEIISCDSRQFYKELLIGTAPPSKKQLNEVKHHFIHNKSIIEDYSAGLFENDVIRKITELHKKNNTIIAVGGSGLYVDAICNGFNIMPNISVEIRKKINTQYKEKGLLWLQEKVKKIDPNFFENCDKKNPRRLIRALEIYKTTGGKISNLKLKIKKKRPFKITKIGLETDRSFLYDKINNRVDQMIKDGLVKEVNSLIKFRDNNSLKTVGYKEIFSLIDSKSTLEEAIENIKKNTRRLAKRQITWFKRDKDINWFNVNQLDDITKFILKL